MSTAAASDLTIFSESHIQCSNANVNLALPDKVRGCAMNNISGWTVLVLGLSAMMIEPGYAQPRGRGGSETVSPEVLVDGNVAFRLLAPRAESVRLVSPDLGGLETSGALTKNDEGVWELVYGPVDPPRVIRYRFDVDGVLMADPTNRETSEANGTVFSMVFVPGLKWMELQDVPHGAVSEVTYFSKALGRFRRMHVYTPPGYESGRKSYPVFYLLHGASDSDDSWTTVGRANVILDNLIAAAKAVPMVVVMPDGHVSRMGRGRRGFRMDEFVQEFTEDIVPTIGKTYRVHTDRSNTAIAGLSMGGGQTLNIIGKDLADYGCIGVFSSGIFGINRDQGGGPSWEEQHLDVLQNPDLKNGLELFWFATGRDDFLVDVSRGTVDLFKKHNFDVIYEETDGAHSWVNWRDYLRQFAPMLFRAKAEAAHVAAVTSVAPKGGSREIGYEQPLIGADISFVPFQEDRGTSFSDQGVEKDVLEILSDHKFNWIRLRLFVDPTAENGYSRRGDCGLEKTLAMAKRIEAAGMKFLLDFHYSDTWADPGKQFTPAAWQGLSDEELADKIYQYTRNVTQRFIDEGVAPEMIQIGNEIHNGFVWPQGKLPGSPETFGTLLRRASEAVRDADPNIKIMVHPALGGDNGRSVRFFDLVLSHDVVFDVIGQSYYPEHHGTLDDLRNNLTDLATRYRKPIVVVEYKEHRKEVNEIVRDLPDDLGWGTFIWEATSPRWGGLFDRNGATTEKIDIYPPFFESFETAKSQNAQNTKVNGNSGSDTSDAVSQSTTQKEEKPITVIRDIAYREGDSDAWRLDLAMPAERTEELRPALVIVHGGGWRGGSRTVDVFQNMMTEYAKKGYVTVNIDYRLTGEAPFPACIEDVKCAVRWLRAHADEYQVDPDRIGAYGHSAGAHLAMMLAMVPKSAGLEGDGGWEEYSSMANAVAAGSPPTELGRDVPMAKPQWWPIGYISADHPPLFLIQGSDDRIVRAALTDDFVEKMTAAGANVQYLKIDGAEHGVAYAEKLEVTEPAIEEFFAEHL